MATEPGKWPQCERCYIAANSKWEPDSVGDDGSLVSKLTAIAIPDELLPGQISICATCGEITIVGIYVEMDEDDVQYEEEPLEYTLTDENMDDDEGFN